MPSYSTAMIKQHQSLASASSSTSSSSSPIITQLINVLNDETQPPTQLEITILPDRPNATATNTATTTNTTTTTKNNNNDDDGDNDDDSDYYFLKDGIHLGIHAPNLPFLARTFRQEYYSLRRSYYSNNQNYSAASSAVAASSSDAVVTATATATETKQDVIEKQLWNATTCLLLVCPDHASAWSDRKRILLNNNDTDVAGDGDHDDALSCCGTNNNVNANANNTCAADNRKWQKELEFLNLLFTQHSKAPNSWSHRKWISKQMISSTTSLTLPLTNTTTTATSTTFNATTNMTQFLMILSSWTENEFKQCTKIAERYPKNYYAWTHRRFVIDTLLHLSLQEQQQDRYYNNQNSSNNDYNTETVTVEAEDGGVIYQYTWKIMEDELLFITQTWISKHVSDHSAIHYAGEILRLLIFFKMRRQFFGFYNTHNHNTNHNDDDNDNDNDNDDDKQSKAITGTRQSSFHSLNQRYCHNDDDITTSNNIKQCTTPNSTTASSSSSITCSSDSDGIIHEWIQNKLHTTLEESQELISKHSLNEVIWIWRRICSQLYIDYLGISFMSVAQQQSSTLNKNIQTLIEFVQKEMQLFSISENSMDIIMDHDDQDMRRNKIHCTTYLLWIMEHLQRQIQQQQQLHSISKSSVLSSELHQTMMDMNNMKLGFISSLKFDSYNNSMWKNSNVDGLHRSDVKAAS